MQGIEGQWNGSVSIGGYEVPLHVGTLLDFKIFNTIHQNLPSLTMSFKDEGARLLQRLGVIDGSEIIVDVGDGGTGSTGPMIFRVMGDLQMQGSTSAEQVTLSAVLDKIPWMRKIVSGSVKGNSSDAIQRLASEAGLLPQVHSTSDSQVWLPTNKTLASHAHHIADRGWASASSCMMLSVQDSGVLRYFDVDRIIGGGVGNSFGLNGIPILQHQISSKASLYNNSAGYKGTTTAFDLEGKFKELKGIAITMLSGNLPVSSSIISSLGDIGGKIMPKPINVGNTHKNWEEALHQNKRIKDLYAHDVNILVDEFSASNLLDKASLKLVANGDESPMVKLTGDYIISAYTRLLTGSRYFEKVTLTNQSTN